MADAALNMIKLNGSYANSDITIEHNLTVNESVSVNEKLIVGDNTVGDDNINSIVAGKGCSVEADIATAMGIYANAKHGMTFVWNGDSAKTAYDSTAAGTFSINPKNGTEGFYIGDKNLKELLGKGYEEFNWDKDNMTEVLPSTEQRRFVTGVGQTNTQISVYGSTIATSDIPNLAANKITLMTGYSKPSATDTISENDSLNEAVGKLEARSMEIQNYVLKNDDIEPGTHTKITYDKKGLVTAGNDLDSSDIPNLDSSKVTSLSDYAKATVEAVIYTTDSLNIALGKLEKGIEGAKSEASTALDNVKKCFMDGYDEDNQLTTKAFVNSTVQTETASFRGSFDTFADVPFESSGYVPDPYGETTPTHNDYIVVLKDENHSDETWRYKYTSKWSEVGREGWTAEYKINDTALTSAQIAALNSTATKTKIDSYSEHINDTNIHISTSERYTWNGKQDHIEEVEELDELSVYKIKADSLGRIIEHAKVNIDSYLTRNTPVTGGIYTKLAFDEKGLVTSGFVLDKNDIPNIDSCQVTSLSAYSKPLTASALKTSDTLNEALGKLERRIEDNDPSGIYAKLDSPDFNGKPLVNTATIETNDRQIASTAFVHMLIKEYLKELGKKNIGDTCTVSSIPDCKFSGSLISPEFSVVDSEEGTTLTPSTDYTSSVKDALSVGVATLIVKGREDYYGKLTKTFNIVQRPMSECSAPTLKMTYAAAALDPVFNLKITENGYSLTKVVEYTVDDSIEYRDAHDYTVRVNAVNGGNFSGYVNLNMEIERKDISAEDVTVENIEDQTYTGEAITPQINAEYNEELLKKNTDYTAEYSNNVNVTDSASVVMSGVGNYAGSRNITFKILPQSISSKTIKNISDVVYDGLPKTPQIEIDGLVESTNFDSVWSNNINATDAAIAKATGKGNYTGTAQTTFKILRADISEKEMTVASGPHYFTGNEIKPTVSIEGCEEGSSKDFTVNYVNNIDVGTATASVSGVNNYSGSNSTTFEVAARSMNDDSVVVEPISDVTWSGSAKRPTVTIVFGEFELTSEDFTRSYSNNVDVGQATITLTGKGNFTDVRTVHFNIVPIDISSATINPISDQTYTGNPITPDVTIDGLVSGTDFDVEYENNTAVGVATVKAIGKGNYTGTATGTFNIVEE